MLGLGQLLQPGLLALQQAAERLRRQAGGRRSLLLLLLFCLFRLCVAVCQRCVRFVRRVRTLQDVQHALPLLRLHVQACARRLAEVEPAAA